MHKSTKCLVEMTSVHVTVFEMKWLHIIGNTQLETKMIQIVNGVDKQYFTFCRYCQRRLNNVLLPQATSTTN